MATVTGNLWYRDGTTPIATGETIALTVGYSWSPWNSAYAKTIPGYTLNEIYIGSPYYTTISRGSQHTVTESVDFIVYYRYVADTPGPSIAKWSWGVTEAFALNNHGAVSAITYLRWNAMVDKVREVQNYLGYSWDNRYATWDNTRCQLNDRVLTAARFNSINYNVMIFYSTHVPLVSSGDPVLGSYFLQLMSKVNDWIDSLT